jgi:outer membrane protein OmpA-like peptidoglycan-associated protein
LANNPSSNVVLIAHPEGKGAASAEVARKRAQSIINFLTGNMNVDKSRVSIVLGGIDTGMSSSKNPKNDAISSMNRRVDFECR